MIRQRGLLAALLAMILMAISCTKTEEKIPIKISINAWPGYGHAFIAKEKGLFEKNGVRVELLFREDISESAQLYKNGESDGFFNVFPDIIMLNSEGIQTQIVYVADFSDTGDQILGRPEFSSMGDLRDKKISFEGINSFSHIFVLQAAMMAGLSENDIQLANIPAGDVLSALEEGKIDAGHTWEPTVSTALEKGYKILAKAGDVPGIIIDLLAFNAKLVRQRPDEIQAIVKAMSEARDFLVSHREESLKIMSQSMKIPLAELEKGVDGVYHLDLKDNARALNRSAAKESLFSSGKFIMDFYIRQGQLSDKMNLDTIIEPKFVNRIIGENK